MGRKGLKNFRDMGGIRLSDGRITRYGLVFRSASLHALSAEDCARLRDEHHIGMIIDLRTAMEVHEKPDALVPGVEYVHIPIFEESVIGITKETGSDTGEYVKRTWNRAKIRAALPDMDRIYADVMADREIVLRIAKVMKTVAGNVMEGKATLLHCSQGKDRTGAVSALLLSLAGAERAEAVRDYVKGGAVYRLKAWKDAILVTLLKLDPAAARIVYHADRAEKRFIEASYDTIERVYGSCEALFGEVMGLERELVERFRKALAE